MTTTSDKVVPTMASITRIQAMHDKQQPLLLQILLLKPLAAQQLGARALHKFQIVNVIDDATQIGVFDIDAKLTTMHAVFNNLCAGTL